MHNSLKFIISVIVIAICLLFGHSIFFKQNNDERFYSTLSTLPVLHEGRIKPLDSFARITLKSIAKKESTHNKSAQRWLIDLLIEPNSDYSNRIFLITEPQIQKLLNLKPHSDSYYSFKEILPGIKQNIQLLTQLQTSRDKLNGIEQQVLELYNNILVYFDLSRSWSLLWPIFDKHKLEQSFNINIPTQHQQTYVSFYQLLPYKKAIIFKVEELYKHKANLNSPAAQNILTIANLFKNTESDKINTHLKIIAPDPILKLDNPNWSAPWETIYSGRGTPSTAKYLNFLQAILHKHDTVTNTLALQNYSIELAANFPKPAIKQQTLHKILLAEKLYNQYQLFNKAIILFLFSLILSIVYLYAPNKFAHLALVSKLFFILGFICALLGIILRIYILQRPPVANLYESILFVSVITSILCCLINFIRKDNIGTLLGSLICCVLLFVANSYNTTGDSLGVVIAVLNNNFWLGTHVVAITSGYGSCLILSALSHVYLLYGIREQINTVFIKKLQKYILAFALLSLFLTLLGTILGGIWADQSWGRFWGWDPKENGALLICLWLIALVHGRISKQLSPVMFASFAALTSVTVALAWFGVNLLSTGLHSYGFTENIALNLSLFIIFELTLITILTVFNKKN